MEQRQGKLFSQLWRMEDGAWRTKDRARSMEDGWMEDGGRGWGVGMEGGGWRVENGKVRRCFGNYNIHLHTISQQEDKARHGQL